MDRRTVVKTAANFCALMVLARAAGPALANPGPGATGVVGGLQPASPDAQPFSRDTPRKLAEARSRKPYQPPPRNLPAELVNLTYDQYRMIAYNRKHALWRNDRDNFNLQFFHSGYLYRDRIRISTVENGEAREVRYSPDLFIWDPKLARPVAESDPGFSGFRVHSPVHRADVMDEFAVFQGASYFRALAAGQEYGLSGRGLAINTGQAGEEEFPIFRDFWIEKPAPNSGVITVHALLDSPSVSGAYTFAISNQTATVMDVEATLFPRKPIAYAGIAPLTSMFRSGPQDITPFDDFRPRVYDSEGLAIWTGSGDRIWRPLINPDRVQFSVFVDESPKGFGLVQRNRDFRDFQDLQARYDLRPSLWVETKGEWGPGSIDLVELPSPNEYNDNIVAFWQPKEPLAPGKSYTYRYRLHWCWEPPVQSNVATVTYTKIAKASKPGWHACHLDIRAPRGFKFCDDFSRICPNKRDNLRVTASKGKIGEIYFEQNPVLGGYRLSFDFWTDGIEQTDLRCVVLSQDRPISEIWTYRWAA